MPTQDHQRYENRISSLQRALEESRKQNMRNVIATSVVGMVLGAGIYHFASGYLPPSSITLSPAIPAEVSQEELQSQLPQEFKHSIVLTNGGRHTLYFGNPGDLCSTTFESHIIEVDGRKVVRIVGFNKPNGNGELKIEQYYDIGDRVYFLHGCEDGTYLVSSPGRIVSLMGANNIEYFILNSGSSFPKP